MLEIWPAPKTAGSYTNDKGIWAYVCCTVAHDKKRTFTRDNFAKVLWHRRSRHKKYKGKHG